ncbi:MAG: hypothetical protein WKF83_09020 [Nocardioidaceae bacterium]
MGSRLVLLLVAGLVGAAVAMFGRRVACHGTSVRRRRREPAIASVVAEKTSEADLRRALGRGDGPTG